MCRTYLPCDFHSLLFFHMQQLCDHGQDTFLLDEQHGTFNKKFTGFYNKKKLDVKRIFLIVQILLAK